MQQLHNKLSKSVPFYRAWHDTPYISLLHFFILAIMVTFCANAIIVGNSVPEDSLSAIAIKGDASVIMTPKTPIASDRILVKFKKSTNNTKRGNVLSKHKLQKKNRIDKVDVDVLSVDPGFTPEEAVQNILRDNKGDIDFAEVDPLLQITATPNDPSFSSQWNKTMVNLPVAWNTNTGSASVIVGIADTGVDCTHPDLAASCVSGWNFYDNNSDARDVQGHGTAVAGVAAAIGNNGVGIAGSTWNSKIMPLRVSDPSGLAYASTIARAITYAADNGAKVVNNSFGGFASTVSTIDVAAKYLWDKGGMLVRSEGNSGAKSNALYNDPYAILVSGSDGGDALYGWSTYGMDVDVSAPGCATVTANGGGYRGFCGTSSAAPEVAGLLALMWSQNPTASPQTIRDTLFASAKDLGTAGWDDRFGWGRIDAAAAMAALSGGTVTPPPVTPPLPPPPSLPELSAASPSPSSAVVNTPLTFSATISNSGNASTGTSFSNFFQVATAANGGGVVSSLSVNSVATLAANGNAPANSSSYTFTTAGTYSVRVCADNNSSFAGTITESNENNNCSTWTNVVVSDVAPLQTSYRYVKWDVTQRKCVDNSVQANELILLQNGTVVAWPNGSSVSNPGGSNPSAEGSSNLIDKNVATKWLDFNFDLDGGDATLGSSKVIVDVGSGNAVNFNGYRWKTANDSTCRDPIGWSLYGSNNGTSYALLDTKSNQTITNNRSTSNPQGVSPDYSVATATTTPPPVVPQPTDTSAPTVPQSVVATLYSGSQVNVSWAVSTDNVGVTGYNLYRNGVKVWNGSAATYSDTSIQMGNTYAYTVSAYDAAGNTSNQSSASSVTTATTAKDTSAPSVPKNLVVTAPSSSQVNLTWSESTDNVRVAGYNIYRNGTKLTSNVAASYVDTTASAGTTYAYTVSAYDAAGNASAQSASAQITTPATALKITSYSVSKKTTTSVTITWTTNQATTGVVNFGTSSGNFTKSVSDTNLSTTHTLTLTGLTKNTTYYYQISATAGSSVKTVQSSVRTSMSSFLQIGN
ncbi:MAG: S8 family serine peptidase [Candidatus Pacebacteria bacterium]|nr:S8 family serine peptidase [Candidatus Paceibacterota bacterium]